MIFPSEIRTALLGKLGSPLFLHYSLHTTGSVEHQFGSL